jgi:TolA-binding protein
VDVRIQDADHDQIIPHSEFPIPHWADRLLSLFRRHAPQLAAKLEDTSQQVDGAIRQYERRHEELVAIARDAEGVTGELAAQVASHQEAAREAAKKLALAEAANDQSLADQLRRQKSEYESTAAEFGKQLAEQRAQNDQLQSQLAQVAGTLQKLRSQRDVLQARLRSAQAQIQMEAGRSHPLHRFRPWAVAAAVLVAMIMLCGLASLFFKSTPPKPAPSPVPPRAQLATGSPAANSTARPAAAEAAATGPNWPIDPATQTLANASDPEFAHLFPEQDTPFTGDLSGRWRLHFPSRYVYLVTLRRVDTDHYQFDSLQHLSGGYVIRGNRLVMDRPDPGYVNVLSKLWKFQWRIDDDHLTLIGEPQPARFGGYSNLGATLERESADDKNSARVTGRFCFVSKGDFELYLNRRKLTFSNNRPPLIDVYPGDSVVVYVGGSDVDRDFRMAFVSDDGNQIWSARRGQFRALPEGKPQQFDAQSIAASHKLPDYGQSDSALAANWSQLKVPPLEGDWIRSGSKDDPSAVGAVIQSEFFSSPNDP